MTVINISTHKAPLQIKSAPAWRTASWWESRLVAITGLALVLAWVVGQVGAPGWLNALLGMLAFVAGGFFGAKNALESLFVKRRIDIDMLMVMAALGAALIGQWPEGAVLLFLFSLSNVLQDYAIGRSRQAIQSLFKLYPEQATVQRGEQRLVVKISEIRLGDRVLIGPGERVPVDGVVLAGRSSVDESPITGESMPIDKTVGDKVFAGTLNEQGALDIEAIKLASEGTLARIIRMVEEAQESKARAQRWLDTFEQRYALFIILATLAFIVVPPILFGADFAANFYRAMVLMTVASPCALVISVPAAFISAIASAAREGVLLKGGAYIEDLARLKAIAFDKTGTLTLGQPRLTDVISLTMDENILLRLAATAESRSEHPLARAIVQEAEARGLSLYPLEKFDSQVGLGIVARVQGRDLTLGRVNHLAQAAPMPAELSQAYKRLEAEGKTIIGVLSDGQWVGLLALADQLRPEAILAVRELHQLGIQVAMLTGDNQRVAQSIAQQVGIDRVFAELLPQDKVMQVEALRAEYGTVAMIGDGVNDAPALASASVGIAMGAAGTDVAMETADVVLMGDRLERIAAAVRLARKAQRVVIQNIAFSLGAIVLLVIGAFVVDLPLPLGVLGHEGSTVVVVLNGIISLLLIPEIQRRRAKRCAC
ncbi:MAG: heavy metal translocating P-type ATPase [Anaerolineae bacterium]|nr:heavy metal translocating P-type ATPase [Anaerolineae bacterium]MDW8172126.1 heavy metal translocating P-type ATPase [Anaerolineae bacterium]